VALFSHGRARGILVRRWWELRWMICGEGRRREPSPFLNFAPGELAKELFRFDSAQVGEGMRKNKVER
jgi:hypothetical protein